jgi:GTP-binding protein HflX
MSAESKKAIIITLNKDTTEIKELADSLGYKTVKIFYQNRQKPDVNSYVGSGKVEDIKDFLENSDEEIDLVFVNSEIKPSQWFYLEKKLKIDVFDRVRLILAIFEERADRKEAKLQVKLAQLQYERPFVRELIHRARAGEHPGFMAGGEYQVDDYYEMIKKQTKKIRDQLDNIREKRELHRQHRHIGGFYLVSIAGYTNAGKSSLLNLLSEEKVKVEGRLFTTLSTTTRRIKNNNIPTLLTDTVGFIQDLPAFVIKAFHSTLEEIKLADVVLLILDISEPLEVIDNKFKASFQELLDLGIESSIILVLNKSDLISKKEIKEKTDFLQKNLLIKDKKMVSISVKNEENIDVLLDLIYNSLPGLIEFNIKLPVSNNNQSFISWIYDKAQVNNISYDDFVNISIKCNVEVYRKIISRCKEINNCIIY